LICPRSESSLASYACLRLFLFHFARVFDSAHETKKASPHIAERLHRLVTSARFELATS
jgi:hypothetical protein